jgi:hypothetical protein
MGRLAIYVAPMALLWHVSGPLPFPRVLFPGRPYWLLLLLFPLSPGLPRMDLPVVTMLLVVPVLRSVHRLMCGPPFPMSVLPQRAAAPPVVILHGALFAPLCLYPSRVALGLWSYAQLVRALHVPPVVPSRVGPGVGVRVMPCGGLLVQLVVSGELLVSLLVRGMMPVPIGARLQQ